MLAFLGGLFAFAKELVKTLIIDTIIGFMLKPVGL